MEKHTMGTLMSALRKTKGMTQQDIADKLGISNKTVSKWECDDGYPDISMLPAIAEIYGISVDELLKGEIRNEEKQEKASSIDKSKKQIELLISTAFEKFKHITVIALVIASLSVVLGFLLKSILDDYLFATTASLIAFCVSLIMSVIAIVLEWFAGSRLAFSFSGDDVINYTDKTVAYLKSARSFISVVMSIALVGIFGSGAMWFAVYYDLVIMIPCVVVAIAIALIISLVLFFVIGNKLTSRIDDVKIKAAASYSRKTALGLIIGTLCVALVTSGIICGVDKITSNHTIKFDNKDLYNDYIACYFEYMYPLLEKDNDNLSLTVVDMPFMTAGNYTDVAELPEYIIGEVSDYVQLDVSDSGEFSFDTKIYTFNSKENMDKFINEYCVGSDFISKVPYELIFSPKLKEHNDDKLTVKYSTGNFDDIAGICAMLVAGICIVFDGIYITVRCSKKIK